MKWRELARERVLSTPVFAVERRELVNPRNDVAHPFFTLDLGDWVTVVALTPQQQVVLVRQYRAGVDDHTLETPGGLIDAGESAETAARRELLEETGYAVTDLTYCGAVMPNPALQNNRCHIFAAAGAYPAATLALDDAEDVEVALVPAHEALVGSGVTHAVALAALLLARPALVALGAL